MCNKVKNAGFCELEIVDLGLAEKCNATCGKCGKFRGQCINTCIHTNRKYTYSSNAKLP